MALVFPYIRVDRHPKDKEYHTVYVIVEGQEFYYNRCLYKSRAQRLCNNVSRADPPLQHFQASDYWRVAPAKEPEQLYLGLKGKIDG